MILSFENTVLSSNLRNSEFTIKLYMNLRVDVSVRLVFCCIMWFWWVSFTIYRRDW